MSITETITQRIEDIPMLPIVVTQLLRIIEDDDHSLRDVVKIVENDTTLTAKVLRISNSAVFYRGQAITTLNRAIMQLGERMVVGVAIGACSARIFNRPLWGYLSSAESFWNHSLRAGVAARRVSEYVVKGISGDLAFTAGLLHDIGKSVISELLQDKSVKIIDQRNGGVEDYLEAEKSAIGIDHSEVGYAVANHWRLPPEICSVIRHHHYPGKTDDEVRELAYAVHLGDIITMLGGYGTGTDSLAYRLDENYNTHIKLDKQDFSRLIINVQDEFTAIKDSIFGEV